MDNKQVKVVTRYAPSPTGFMHVGGVRTALYAYLWAKKNNGTFILRIEDTDKKREVAGSISHIMESLRWLKISWDEGPDIGGTHAPYVQSERLESYKKYAQILIEKGLAYPDPYSESELEVFRNEAQEKKRAFLYRDHRPTTFGAWDGTKPLRFKVPEIKSYTWNDMIRGELSAGPEALDDFILMKSDGYPTYNFAHIIDDFEMNVTHIMRADEFIASTPRFLSLYEALDITPPSFVTLPPILGEEGTKKLGKRDGAKDILEYRSDGYLPDAVTNFLAFLGWNPGDEREIFTQNELLDAFNITRIHKSGAMLDEKKLRWINKEHIKKQSTEVQLEAIKLYMTEYNDNLLIKLLPSIIDRIEVYSDIKKIKDEEFSFLLKQKEFPLDKLAWKTSNLDEALNHLKNLIPYIEPADFTSVDTIKNACMPYAEIQGKGNVLWPLRMSLSGQEKSMDPFSICYLLGKDEVLRRLQTVISL